ncbi:MAG: hypothetical protein ACFFDT_06825 [Candidatus Hodarchaeota archaeon]
MSVSTKISKIKALICAVIAGLILIYSEISMRVGLGIKIIEFVQDYFVNLSATTQSILADILIVLITVSNYLGMVIILVGILIFLGRVKMAKYLFIITIGAGIFGLAIPLFSALIFGGQAIEAVINSIGTKYIVVICLSIMTKLYGDQANK